MVVWWQSGTILDLPWYHRSRVIECIPVLLRDTAPLLSFYCQSYIYPSIQAPRIFTAAPECARPRAQQDPTCPPRSKAPRCHWFRTLLRPGTGALRAKQASMLVARARCAHSCRMERWCPSLFKAATTPRSGASFRTWCAAGLQTRRARGNSADLGVGDTAGLVAVVTRPTAA